MLLGENSLWILVQVSEANYYSLLHVWNPIKIVGVGVSNYYNLE